MVEQIESGETGILIDPSNLGELETAVRSLLDDEAKRTEIGQTARMEVTRRNHPEVIGSQLEEALRQIHSQC
jgi:glycosyltransferase involved in cell wall biosynthesis